MDDTIRLPMGATLNREQRMSILRRYRTYPYAIHVIFGPKIDATSWPEKKEVGGICVEFWQYYFEVVYPDSPHLTRLYMEHYSSGGTDLFAEDSLNSTGCYVFYDYFDEIYITQDSLVMACALTMAHEIGHALGMHHTNAFGDEGVMYSVLYTKPLNYWSRNFFLLGSLDDCDNKENPDGKGGALNIREILGRDVVWNDYAVSHRGK